MPLSEFYGLNRSAQQKATACSTNISSVHDNEVVELIWENGQIMVQGQSNRARKGSCSNNFSSQTQATRLLEKDTGNDTSSKMGKFGMVESILNDVPLSVPSCDLSSGQDDDMVPWLNYTVDEGLDQDYYTEFLPEISGVTVNEPSAQHSFASTTKGPSCNQMDRRSHNVSLTNTMSLELGNASKTSPSRNGHVYPLASQRSETSMVSHSGVLGTSGSNTGNTNRTALGYSIRDQVSADGLTNMKVQKPDFGVPSNTSSLLNFSHFLRPAAIARVNVQNITALVTSGSSREELEKKDKDVAAIDGCNADLLFDDSNRYPRKEIDLHDQPNVVSWKFLSKPSMADSVEQSHPAEHSYAVCGENIIRNAKSTNQSLGARATQRLTGCEKAVEPIVASSSVCSGNSADGASNELTNNLKRKRQDDEECEWPSEDVEEDSVGVNKEPPVQGSAGIKGSSKRSRAAEVHNLSERRRRERINEKMRALQELIPNCNKVDKASMLDEAIEYLKTLQLQVQIMSMGAGLYMPPMMLPTGMQHLRPTHMPHFSPMGVGMAMGFGMGMGLSDMNGVPPGCPMIPISPMQGAHFLAAPISRPPNFQGLPGSGLPAFVHPCQGMPMSMTQPPFHPLSGWSSINPAMVLNASRMGLNSDIPNPTTSLNTKDLLQNSNAQEIYNADASQANQLQTSNEGFQLSGVANNDQVPDVGGSGPTNSTIANDVVPSEATSCD